MKTKKELILRGKELGLNLKESMSLYELTKRVEEAESAGKSKEPAKSSSKAKGEY